jgi:hypothetical protein
MNHSKSQTAQRTARREEPKPPTKRVTTAKQRARYFSQPWVEVARSGSPAEMQAMLGDLQGRRSVTREDGTPDSGDFDWGADEDSADLEVWGE